MSFSPFCKQPPAPGVCVHVRSHVYRCNLCAPRVHSPTIQMRPHKDSFKLCCPGGSHLPDHKSVKGSPCPLPNPQTLFLRMESLS